MSLDAKEVLSNPHEEISRLCEIDLDNIEGCLHTHAVLYGRAYSYYQAARAKENSDKWLYERTKAKAVSRLRKKGVAATLAKDQAEVEQDVLEHYERLLESEKRTSIFWALLKALEARKDMLIQLSSREKKEYGAF